MALNGQLYSTQKRTMSGVKRTVKDYSESTTIHGISYIFESGLSALERLKDISTPDFSTPNFNPGLFNHELFNPGLFNHESLNHGDEQFMVENSGVEMSQVGMSSL